MQDKELSHEDSLKLIQGMMDVARNKINETGFHFLLWGFLVIAACLANYFLLLSGVGVQAHLVWPAMTLIGVPVAFLYEYKKRKTERSRSKFDRIYAMVWLGFGITLFFSIYISVSKGVNPIPFILVLVGLATFISGIIYRFTPLIIGACIFWISAVICVQISDLNQLLVDAAAIALGYLIPGLILWRKAKKEAGV